MSRQLDSTTRARRLLALLPHLRKGDRIPLSELAAAVGCTTDEVASDLATLTMCGIPPFTPFDLVDLDIDGDAVTVYLEPPGLEQPLRLTVAEARAVNAALEAAGYAADSVLRTRLADTAAHDVSADELEHTIRVGVTPGGAADVYSTLAIAAEEHEKLRIAYYTGSSGTVKERVVHPWALVQRLGVWYLIAWCETAGQERVFRLDRIKGVEHTGAVFQPPTSVSTLVTPDTNALPPAEIRFDSEARLPDERQWPGVSFERQADGSTIARVPYQSVSWIARRVVAFLGSAEVISPGEVRDAVRDLADDLLRQVR
jgi:proteasome accessory factor C